MTLLLPSLQAERIRRSIVDYLSTTFALTDAEPRRVLTDFLQDEEQGVFIGPFVRLRLPYLAASAPTGDTATAEQLQTTRTMVETGNFVRASLLTSVMAFSKTFFCVFLALWVRWSFPRLRIDQLLKLEWKILMPIAFANLILMALWILVF